MSKAILIIDKPERWCIKCPCYELESGTCQALPNDDPLDHYDINDNHIIPKDCPLKEYKEAIPIEWLLKRAKLCTADYADCLHYAVEAWQTEQKYIVNGQWKFPKEWEKENEIYNDTKAVDPEIHG